MNTKKYGIYRFISLALSHPFTALFFISIVYFLTKASTLDGITTVLGVSLVPILPSTVWALKKGKSFFMENRKERAPFLLVSSFILLAESVLGKIAGLPLLFTVSLLYGINTLAIFLVNFKMKASVHVAGIAGPVTFLAFCFTPKFAALYLLALPSALSRYKLRAHTEKELVAGFATAFFVTLFVSAVLGKII